MPLFMWTDQVPSIPASMALAAVALIGYLVGRQSRPTATAVESAEKEKISRALAEARHLEQITDEVLSVTREALDQCRKLRIHCESPAVVSRPTAEYASACDDATGAVGSVYAGAGTTRSSM